MTAGLMKSVGQVCGGVEQSGDGKRRESEVSKGILQNV